MWGMRAVVPTKLQSRILSELHFTRPGIVKMKLLAHSYVCVVIQNRPGLRRGGAYL